jgi:threonyl-tRNA synthetase
MPSSHRHLQHIGYDAEQGRFDVWLNPDQCYLMATDSTVELIASHIANALQQEAPEDHWRVKAFEGVQ